MPKRLLICTDLDRTLLPNGKQPESPGARKNFTELVSHPEITLAYVSGRHRRLVETAISEFCLPYPSWVVGDVGSTIYQITNKEWVYDQDWERDIAVDWQGLTADDLRQLFADIPALQLQEESKQNQYKLSYYLTMDANTDALKQELNKRLTAYNLSASLTYSVDEIALVGLLDVLPLRATKGHAVAFLMQKLGFYYTNTVFAGDSGNDLPVLASGIPSVLVANADAGVKEQAIAQAQQQGTLASLYLAQGGFLDMNGNYSAGILEGIAHFHPETRFCMR